eukprot:7798343-Karenia_brevis.AAC.1
MAVYNWKASTVHATLWLLCRAEPGSPVRHLRNEHGMYTIEHACKVLMESFVSLYVSCWTILMTRHNSLLKRQCNGDMTHSRWRMKLFIVLDEAISGMVLPQEAFLLLYQQLLLRGHHFRSQTLMKSSSL